MPNFFGLVPSLAGTNAGELHLWAFRKKEDNFVNILLECLELVLWGGRETEVQKVFHFISREPFAANGPKRNGCDSVGNSPWREEKRCVGSNKGSVTKRMCPGLDIFANSICVVSNAGISTKLGEEVSDFRRETLDGVHGVETDHVKVDPLEQSSLTFLDGLDCDGLEFIAIEGVGLGFLVDVGCRCG